VRFPSNDAAVISVNQNDALLAGVTALIDAGESAGLSLRLLGGLSVRLGCPSSAKPPFDRACSDADCVVAADTGMVQNFLCTQGWLPEAEFNLYNGDRRLLFSSADGNKLDVFIRIFSMCHDFDFSRRIPVQGYTVYPADLVLTKLQIHEINDKDLQDAACIFLDNEVCKAGDTPGKTDADRLEGGINADYIAGLCSADWGLEYSLVTNLKKTLDWATRATLGPAELATVHDRIAGLITRIQEHEKTLVWRSRALLGTRLKWYKDVEEVDR